MNLRNFSGSALLVVILGAVPSEVFAYTFTSELSLNASSAEVVALQEILKEKGFYTHPEITGYFGPVTQAAVKAFQTSLGFEPVGYLGPKTRAALQGASVATSDVVPGSGTLLRVGDVGQEVRTLQEKLSTLGFYTHPEITGYFGPLTEAAVKVFQASLGLESVGYLGPKTRAALFSTGDREVSLEHTQSSSEVTIVRRVRSRISNSDQQEYSADTTAPVISNVAVATTTTTATITWTTDEAATSRVEYGATSSYGSASSSVAYVTSHSVTITGLTGETVYHYQVESEDNSLNTTSTSDGTFTTDVVKQRLVPVNSNTFYIVSQHPDMGGIAHRFQRNNAGDSSTPSLSIGTPFEPWRHTGTFELDDLADDPADFIGTFSSDTGSQDYAIQLAASNLFGGSYHGGDDAHTETITGDGVAVDPTVATEAVEFTVYHNSTITWPTSPTANIDYTVTVNDQGELEETMTASSTASMTSVFFGMTIGTGDYLEATMRTSTGIDVVVPLSDGEMTLATSTQVTLRNTDAGYAIQVATNAPSKSGYERTKIVREDSLGRSKLYMEFNPGVLGTKSSVTRTTTFIKESASPATFGSNLVNNGDFSSGDLTGWTATIGSGTYNAGQMRMTRSATVENRVFNDITTEVGAFYYARAYVSNTSGVASPALAVSSAANGSVSTPAPALTFPTIGAIGVNGAVFQATLTTHYMMARQTTGTAGTTLDYDNFEVVKISP